jgi:hypothetical protein
MYNLVSNKKELDTNTGRKKREDKKVTFEDVKKDQYGNVCNAQVLKINPEKASLKIGASITTKSVKNNDAHPHEKKNNVNRVSLCE